MRNRWLAAVGAALLSVGQAAAQAPADKLPETLPPPEPLAIAPRPAEPEPLAIAPRPAAEPDLAEPVNLGGRFWTTGDYLFSWMHGVNVPPLVTTSPAGTAMTAAGVIGPSTTTVLYGDQRVDEDLRAGFRLEMGYWFNTGRDVNLGVETGFTMIDSQSSVFGASSSGTPILARPYIDAATGNQQTVLVAFPGLSSGTVLARVSSDSYYDANVDLDQKIWDGGWWRLDGIFGYRFFRYDEGLHIDQTLTPTNGVFAAGTQIATLDDFVTHNEFNGGELGLRALFRWESLSLGLLGKLAMGNITRNVIINGGQTVTVPGAAPVVETGGVYALSSNIGVHTDNNWTVLPEFGFHVGWHYNEHLDVRLGYSVLFLERIAHAVDQVNFTVNPNLFPGSTATGGPTQPAFTGVSRADMAIQMLSLGIEISY